MYDLHDTALLRMADKKVDKSPFAFKVVFHQKVTLKENFDGMLYYVFTTLFYLIMTVFNNDIRIETSARLIK